MLKKILVAAAVAAAIAACSSTKEPVVEPVPTPMPVASAPVASEPVASAPVEAPAPVVSNHNSVYYGFDKYDINPQYTDIIKANANHLAASGTAKVQIQGNTDDIGSVEYNLALGQKRADAVKKALIANGANAKQIETVSNGKLKPKYANDNDASRAQNRRADIIYKSGQPAGFSLDSNGLPMVDGSFYSGTVTEGVQ